MQFIGKFCCLHEKCVYIFLPHFPDRLVESGSILALTKRLLTTITATPSPTTTLGKVTFAITSRYDARKENIIVHSLDVNQRPLIVGSALWKILTGNLTLSGAYWFKKDSGPLTSLQCTLITGIKCSKLLYIVEKSAGQSPFWTSKHRTKSGLPLKFFVVYLPLES